MRTLLYALLVAVLIMGTAQAGTILLVSDCNDPGTAGGDHNDDSFVTWLASLGHTVDTYGMGQQMREDLDATDLDHANDADLIIVSRKTDSGKYNKPSQWNTLATPLILCSGYLTRDSRWKWTAGGSQDATKSETDMDIDDALTGHDFVAGVSDPTGLFDWSGVPAGDNQAPKGVYLPKKDGTADFDDEATVIGTFDGYDMLADLPAGATMSNGDVLAARRAFLSHWGYDDPTTGTNGPGGTPSEWEDYITDDYKTVLGNMVGTMIPEPATLTLLGLGLGAMLVRRRK